MALPNDKPIILLGALNGVWLPHPTEESTIFHCSRHLIIDRIHHNPPLPTLFLNHVLYPTITTKGFTTKLYHINGKGKDAGVVYSARMRAWYSAISPLANKFIEIDCPLCTGALWKKTATSGRGEVNHNDVPVVGAI
ncbi:hypothetical protein PCASD_24133 [Puccinia coronata f. sp. avenae]|uniref:Uncharacterized protein n=1 Tax=Puccinia coronata f. sp. avenae TaxID=200324 RepID=A0A2N5TK69_9BASI|nr:hypothetical protein PCASD_24133 [Puccinia coronata f. sp. avenae]